MDPEKKPGVSERGRRGGVPVALALASALTLLVAGCGSARERPEPRRSITVPKPLADQGRQMTSADAVAERLVGRSISLPWVAMSRGEHTLTVRIEYGCDEPDSVRYQVVDKAVVVASLATPRSRTGTCAMSINYDTRTIQTDENINGLELVHVPATKIED